jgi:hypothetical protein
MDLAFTIDSMPNKTTCYFKDADNEAALKAGLEQIAATMRSTGAPELLITLHEQVLTPFHLLMARHGMIDSAICASVCGLASNMLASLALNAPAENRMPLIEVMLTSVNTGAIDFIKGFDRAAAAEAAADAAATRN